MKPYWYCPCCGGNGYETYRVWGMDAATKCPCCKGFGIVSFREMVAYLAADSVTLDGERI